MITRLLIGTAAVSFIFATTPALAQIAPPPGVAQGTVPLFPKQLTHVPPVIRSAGPPVQPRGMHDRVVTREEMLDHVRAMFARIDTNHDGYITRSELSAFHQKMMGAMAMRAGAQDRFKGAHFEHGFNRKGDQAKRRAALFDRLDTNHDGVISREEFMAAGPRMHEDREMAMHDHGPGGPEEMSPSGMHMRGMDSRRMHDASMHRMGMRHAGMRGGFGARLFAMADKNHDGRVSLAEVEAAALRHFDQIDVNHDGKITPDERRQAHERMRAARPAE